MADKAKRIKAGMSVLKRVPFTSTLSKRGGGLFCGHRNKKQGPKTINTNKIRYAKPIGGVHQSEPGSRNGKYLLIESRDRKTSVNILAKERT